MSQRDTSPPPARLIENYAPSSLSGALPPSVTGGGDTAATADRFIGQAVVFRAQPRVMNASSFACDDPRDGMAAGVSSYCIKTGYEHNVVSFHYIA